MAEYTLKITPIADFFFGTENINQNTSKVDYFLQSNYLPQQTTLLGLLRYVILHKNNLLGFSQENMEKSKCKIGKASFVVDLKEEAKEQDFGIIQKMTHLFFLNKTFPVQFLPFNHHLKVTKNNNQISLDGYKVKAESFALKLDLDSQKTEEVSNIFIKNQKPGNTKSQDGEAKEDGYYLQQFMQFKENRKWSFAVNITLNDDDEFKDYKCIVPFGGEKKLFEIQFMPKIESKYPNISKVNPAIYGLYLLSDAFLTNIEIDAADFCITKNNTFRNGVISEHGNYKKSELLNLCTKGSVFYYKEERNRNDLAETLENLTGFNIGFNQFQKIN